MLLERRPLVIVVAADEMTGRSSSPGDATTYGLATGHTFAVLTLTTGRLVRSVRNVHLDHCQVPVVLAVVPAARLVRHQHLSALVRVSHRSRLLAATPSGRLEPDVLSDVPAPVGPVRTA